MLVIAFIVQGNIPCTVFSPTSPVHIEGFDLMLVLGSRGVLWIPTVPLFPLLVRGFSATRDEVSNATYDFPAGCVTQSERLGILFIL